MCVNKERLVHKIGSTEGRGQEPGAQTLNPRRTGAGEWEDIDDHHDAAYGSGSRAHIHYENPKCRGETGQETPRFVPAVCL